MKPGLSGDTKMNIDSNHILAVAGLGMWELIAILAVMAVMVGMVILVVGIVFWSNRKKPVSPPPAMPTPTTPAPTPLTSTVRLCPKCSKQLAADSPQGLCPSCLMKAAFTTAPGTGGVGDATPPLPADLAAHFPQLEILELLGQGGMGMVYKARQPQLDRSVALKVLPIRDSGDPAFEERFVREARALAKLNHPNIVAVHDFGQTGKYCWFIMEYVDGVNLRQMEQTQRLTPEQAISIVPKVCDALQYAHDEGVVHRDIKPGNILIDKKGRVKIADFGLAKIMGKKDSEAHLTQSNVVMGTPHYMAPEQMNSPLTVDHRADIYSLGVVFYEMLTGELPMGRFAPPSQKVQVDVRLDEVVLRSLENEPARRYQQASEVRSDVEKLSKDGSQAASSSTGWNQYGGEYRSATMVGGWPLVHITWGIDPATGRKRVAKGVIAIGDVARGIVAFGGVATGVLAFGGIALGVLAVGGIGMGLVSFAGIALGVLFAYGGIAAGFLCAGGVAMGWFAAGSATFGKYQYGGGAFDQPAADIFSRFLGPWLPWLMMALTVPSFLVPSIAYAFVRRDLISRRVISSSPEKVVIAGRLSWPSTGLLLSVALNWLVLIIFGLMLAYDYQQRRVHVGFVSSLSPVEAFEQRFQIPFVIAASLGGILLLITSVIVAWGALKMRNLESYGLALAACIFAIVTSPASLLGLVVGLWGLVVLLQPEVRKVFR